MVGIAQSATGISAGRLDCDMHYVYILESAKDKSLYVGSAKNVQERVEHHNKGYNRSTKSKLPWRIAGIEKYPSSILAVRREKFLKSGDGRRALRNLLKGSDK